MTVGASRSGSYPILGKWVSLGSDSTIIGNCLLENYSSVASGTSIFNQKEKKNTAIRRDKDGKISEISQASPLAEHIFS